MELMHCGHPKECVKSTYPNGIGTCYCSACLRESEIFRRMKRIVSEYREFAEGIPSSSEKDADIQKAVLNALSSIELRMSKVEKEWISGGVR